MIHKPAEDQTTDTNQHVNWKLKMMRSLTITGDMIFVVSVDYIMLGDKLVETLEDFEHAWKGNLGGQRVLTSGMNRNTVRSNQLILYRIDQSLRKKSLNALGSTKCHDQAS